MAKVLSKDNISTGKPVEAWNVTQSIDAFTGEEAYDISISGSFILTGSLYIDGTIFGATTGTSSISDISDYTLYTPSTDYTPLATYNESDYLTLQFYHTPFTFNPSTNYNIGAGESPDLATRVGIVVPIDCYIREAFISISSETPGSSEKGALSLYNNTGSLYSFSERPIYDEKFTTFSEIVDINVTAGTILLFRLTTPPWTSNPITVTHNITLNLLPI